MMKWWSRFLKKRRQSDRVKIMLLFFLVGIGFLGDFIYRGMEVYQTVNSPVEYVLTNASGKVTDAQIARIRDLDNIKAVSRQQETVVSLKNEAKSVSFTCVGLSADYLESVYGIQEAGSMKTFYLNQAAWEQVVEIEDEQGQRSEGTLENEEADIAELRVEYTMAGEEGTKPETGTAKAVLNGEGKMGTAKAVLIGEGKMGEAEAVLFGEEKLDEQAYVFYEINSAVLSGETEAVRVQVGKQDLEGMNLSKLNQIGLETTNADAVKLAAIIQKMQFLRMKYDAVVVVLSLLAVGCLKKWRQ